MAVFLFCTRTACPARSQILYPLMSATNSHRPPGGARPARSTRTRAAHAAGDELQALADRERVQGANHPVTLISRNKLERARIEAHSG